MSYVSSSSKIPRLSVEKHVETEVIFLGNNGATTLCRLDTCMLW